MAKIVQKKFTIEGMHCTSCAILIDGNLEDLEGVREANTNYAKSEIIVEYDEEQVEVKDIIENVKRSGYKVVKVNE